MFPFVIAEFGSSPAQHHWGLAPWCEAARAAGAAAVKVQLFKADHFPVGEQAGKRSLEFPRRWLPEFVRLAHAHGLSAGASVFDLEAVILAAHYCDFLKLAAREQHNAVLTGQVLDAARKSGKPVYRSVAFVGGRGYGEAWPDVYLTMLYTIPKYPAPLVTTLIDLFRFAAYARRHEMRWGWSSHTRSIWDCVLAARLGARVIEKHLALARTDLEASHSLRPKAFGRMVKEIHKWQK